jgi:dimethylargininase
MFRHAIVRRPGATFAQGLTSADLGPPDLARALAQHAAYVAALEGCGLAVTVLGADERFPDSTFVEDTAVVTDRGAVIARPGAPARQGEAEVMAPVLEKAVQPLARIQPPGTLDGGDVLQADDCFFIGLSARTNAAGAGQLLEILKGWGFTGTTVPLEGMLHLKTGVTYLGGGWLALTGELVKARPFRKFDTLIVPAEEAYAANCIRVNNRVLMPAGFSRTRTAFERAGFDTVALEMSEFRKMDGGLSCLSLRF